MGVRDLAALGTFLARKSKISVMYVATVSG